MLSFFIFKVVDNHVIRYTPPEEFHPPRTSIRNPKSKRRLGCLLVGAESADPQTVCTYYKFVVYNLKVCHPRCVRSIIQSCSVYVSIYTYSHKHNNITISSNI